MENTVNQSPEEIKQKRERTRKIIKTSLFWLLIACAIASLFLLIYCRDIWGDTLGDAVLGEGVRNGWVALGGIFKKQATPLVSTIIIIAVSILLITFSNFLIRITTFHGKKAKTVGSLVRSLIKYIVIILGLAFILAAWGVDVASIVAGLGILTLIIGLGCQSLIQDIVSGLFIVFDDYFSVGDMIVVDDFRGTVESIGLRTVKLDDGCGNIKSITNSAIATCVNLSRSPNLIAIDFQISYREDLEHVEAVMIKEFPRINASLPQLSSPLVYKGVAGFSTNGVSLAFRATCPAEYRFQVARDLRREIYLALKRNNIEIPLQQIVCNSPLPENAKKASKEEKELVNTVNTNNRMLETEEEKTFLEKAKESIPTFEIEPKAKRTRKKKAKVSDKTEKK